MGVISVMVCFTAGVLISVLTQTGISSTSLDSAQCSPLSLETKMVGFFTVYISRS